MNYVLKLFWALLPFLVSALLVGAVGEDFISFGCGDKDIFLSIPLLLWSFVYLCTYLVLSWRRHKILNTVAMSSVVATVVVIVIWLALLVFLAA